MSSTKFMYWEDAGMWIGNLEDHPDYRTQGISFEELQTNLKDLYDDLTHGKIPCARRVADLQLS